MKPPLLRHASRAAGLAALLGWAALRAAAAPDVNVLLWFDTEDYLLPADDDATKHLATMLSERGIRATFKVVGEKARVLERRGRTDVIQALKKHDIGYHSNFHSVHPTPSEYLAHCGWEDGVAEFVRHEHQGAADVRRIFGVETLVCYGQPGASWAPQPYAALPVLHIAPAGVPCYVDEDSHIKLEGRPFWYANALTVFNMAPNFTRMELHDPGAVQPAKQAFAAIASRLAAKEGGGLISIYYHPCEWVHQEFWDGVNFKHGANPPRGEWKPPGQLPAAETEAAFQRFGEYIDSMRAQPGVRFVTATNLPALYPDTVRTAGAEEKDLQEICASLLKTPLAGLDYLTISGRAYSVADQFELLSAAVAGLIRNQPPAFPLRTRGLLGPGSPPPASQSRPPLAWAAFRDTALDVQDYIATHRQVPSRVFIGPDELPPADFLIGLAFALDFHRQHSEWPKAGGVPIGNGPELLPAAHVAKESPAVFGKWVIHREGFRAPQIREQARLQAWTLKPALRAQ